MRTVSGVVLVVLAGCVEPSLVREAEQLVGDAGPYVCNPMTCTGCCRENVCLGGNHLDACGYDGRACRVCGEHLQCVSPGTCVAEPSDAGYGRRVPPLDGGASEEPFMPPERRNQCWFFGALRVCG